MKNIRLEHRHFEVKWDEEGYHILPTIRFEKCCYAWCIYCDKWHIHGAGDGHRVAHCYDDTPYKDKGYILEEVLHNEQNRYFNK